VKSTDTVHSTKETQRRTRKAAKGADEDGDTPLLDGVEEPEARDG
jgi:phage portal protein BeeE